jgi:hypothetical protein
LKASVFESAAAGDAEKVETDTLSWRLRLARRHIYMKAVYLRSLLRSRVDPRPVVHVMGDSHVGIFLKKKPFVAHWFGPATAYRLKSPTSTTGSNRRLLRVLRHVVREKDKVLLVFGEIDCRVHIYNQHVRSGGALSLQDVVDDTVSSYGVVLDRMDRMGTDFYVASVPPAAEEGNIFGVPNYPPIAVRSIINRVFNERLSDYCADHGYRFVDVYSRVVDSEGFIRSEFSCDDGTHLKPEAIRFFREGLGLREVDRA